jgi:hypothetical protein
MTIQATFQFESAKRLYKYFTYCSGVKDEKAREYEYHNLLEEANRYGHDIGAKLIDVRIING